MNSTYIDTPDALQLACQQFADSDFICVDTEFHRETTYYPELALIQIGDAHHAVCIDPLALDSIEPVLELFRNEKILKVFHAPGQDLEIFHTAYQMLPRPIFDTQIAAALLGYGEQIGYAALMKICLNEDIDKTQTRTDWMKRPLSPKQIEYAANDVIYLAKAFPQMRDELEKLGRLSWLEEDFAALSDPASFTVQTDTMWRKVKGVQRLHGQQLAILQALAQWREEQAMARNLPRRRLLPDDALLDMARQQPASTQAIRSLRSLQKSRLNQDDLQALLNAMKKGQATPKDQWPRLPKKHKLNAQQDAQVDALSALLKLQAAEHNIHHSSIAPRKQLEALVRGERDLEIMRGWRKIHAGQRLVDFIDGKICLGNQSGQLIINPTNTSS